MVGKNGGWWLSAGLIIIIINALSMEELKRGNDGGEIQVRRGKEENLIMLILGGAEKDRRGELQRDCAIRGGYGGKRRVG